MIRLPNQEELKQLKDFDGQNCVTIYLSFKAANASTNPNRIELKNLLAKAEIELKSAGANPKSIKKTLRPAFLMLDDSEFWPVQRESLVLFMHASLFNYFLVPDADFHNVAIVKKGFKIEPLLKVVQENKEYLVLALGHKNVRLYRGDHYQIKPVHLKDFPTDMKETLNIDEYPHMSELHPIAAAGHDKKSAGYHGQYNVKETDKDMLLQFFRRIDKRMHTYLQKNQSPLIIAGVGYLLPIYRRANTSKSLLRGGLTGNTEHTNLDIIRKQAWNLVNQAL